MKPIFVAVHRGDLDAVLDVLKKGESVDAVDVDGRSLLINATIEKKPEIAKALIDRGAKVNLQDKAGWTALHFAAQEYQPEIAKALLEAGATVDIGDENGNAPLGRAVFDSRGREEIIHLLLSHGADRNRENNHGISPWGLAKTVGNYDLETPFREWDVRNG